MKFCFAFIFFKVISTAIRKSYWLGRIYHGKEQKKRGKRRPRKDENRQINSLVLECVCVCMCVSMYITPIWTDTQTWVHFTCLNPSHSLSSSNHLPQWPFFSSCQLHSSLKDQMSLLRLHCLWSSRLWASFPSPPFSLSLTSAKVALSPQYPSTYWQATFLE